MKKYFGILFTTALTLALGSAYAQPGGAAGAPGFDGGFAKLFGNNSAFTAKMEVTASDTVMPGKISFLDGKSRVEMNTSDAKGSRIPPQAAEQMKAMGMDKMVAISRPDKQLAYVIYPGLKSYAEVTSTNSAADTKPEDFNIKTTELGKETVDGHPCTKNKAVISDTKGTSHEATLWNATDLKNFPVKIQQDQEGQPVVMKFSDIKLGKPEAAQFDPPSDFKKYPTIQAMMQDVIMKRFGGGAGAPPASGQ